VKWLLDTNALAEPARPRPSAPFLKRLQAASKDLAISSITLHEVLFGLERLPEGKRRRLVSDYLESFVARIPVLPYDRAAAAWHAKERARLAAAGRPPPFADGQIAAVAATRGLVLVTANLRDFAAFKGLRTEDWTAG
jgi:tRNA(fMet)-specific endonuclease VapC